VTFVLSAATQLNVDPATLAVNPKLRAVPEQTFPVVALVITGIGFTVTVTVCEVPEQPFKVGVTV
jgi:hypothetical protein